jgi:hypothetical protein
LVKNLFAEWPVEWDKREDISIEVEIHGTTPLPVRAGPGNVPKGIKQLLY